MHNTVVMFSTSDHFTLKQVLRVVPRLSAGTSWCPGVLAFLCLSAGHVRGLRQLRSGLRGPPAALLPVRPVLPSLLCWRQGASPARMRLRCSLIPIHSLLCNLISDYSGGAHQRLALPGVHSM